LRTRPTTLAGRVHVGDHRPLLGDKPAETLAAMADQRSDLYRQVATATIDTDDRAPDAVADLVFGLLAHEPTEA
jgi:shikimate kinase